MELSTKFIRTQLGLFKPFVSNCTLETTRKGQDTIGALMASIHKNDVTIENHSFGLFDSVMITPRDEIASGIILYLHGGGYTCGDISYVKGFGATLSAQCGIKVFCPAYRLAPESIFPAAVDDAFISYRHLISLGYSASDIVLCGESAGGGLIFALCLKLKSLGYELPAGIIAISPWTDLTMSGRSFKTNKSVDPSMTRDRLKYYADCYVHGVTTGIGDSEKDLKMKTNPLVSPLFGELSGMPQSLIFVGGDEIMLDDARLMHEKLTDANCRSQLIVANKMWHAYLLYGLKERASDFDRINNFLKEVLPRSKKLRWMRLDNAAKIYPAAKKHNWSNVFRLSAMLNENIDRDILKTSLDVTVRRFPSIAVRLRLGMFWYYLEEIPQAPEIVDEKSYPLVRMPFDDIRKCAFRVLIYDNRIAVEFFHALTDGTGGLVFLKTLIAEYIYEKYNIEIPATDGVLDRLEPPRDEELEDSFQKHCGNVSASRRESTAYKITGEPEPDGFRTNTVFMLNAHQINDEAKKLGVTVTAYLTAALISAVINIQRERVRSQRLWRPVKILIPVNLRKLYGSRTLRNFVLYTTPGIDPRLGNYDFTEICRIVYHQMSLSITPKQMSAKITPNVKSERLMVLKIMPLFIKNFFMKAVFTAVGEKKSCFTLSNLGVVTLPQEMKNFISRMDFVLGVQATAPYNCGVITYDDTLYLNIIRNITDPVLELHFYQELKKLGVHVKVESNLQSRPDRRD